MTETPDALPILSVGSHDAGSGRMCVMNAISYLQGDKRITDFPSCVDPYLAVVAQLLNDGICAHAASTPVSTPEALCSECAHTVWMFGLRLMGTAEPWREEHLGGARAMAWRRYLLYRDFVVWEVELRLAVDVDSRSKFWSPPMREAYRLTSCAVELLRKVSYPSRRRARLEIVDRAVMLRETVVLQSATASITRYGWAFAVAMAIIQHLIDTLSDEDSVADSSVIRQLVGIATESLEEPVLDWANRQVEWWEEAVYGPAQTVPAGRLPTREEIATIGQRAAVAVGA